MCSSERQSLLEIKTPPAATNRDVPPFFFVLFDLRLEGCGGVCQRVFLCAALQPTTTPAEVLRSAHSKKKLFPSAGSTWACRGYMYE